MWQKPLFSGGADIVVVGSFVPRRICLTNIEVRGQFVSVKCSDRDDDAFSRPRLWPYLPEVVLEDAAGAWATQRRGS